MSLDKQYEEELIKIENRCYTNNLNFDFLTTSFPVIAKITPTDELKNQMVIDFGDEDSNFVNGEIQIIFSDEMEIKVKNDFVIPEKELNYIKNAAKRLHYIFCRYIIRNSVN